jgi:hypothetical protein
MVPNTFVLVSVLALTLGPVSALALPRLCRSSSVLLLLFSGSSLRF